MAEPAQTAEEERTVIAVFVRRRNRQLDLYAFATKAIADAFIDGLDPSERTWFEACDLCVWAHVPAPDEHVSHAVDIGAPPMTEPVQTEEAQEGE
jgi:hypothetical protein